MNRNRRNTLSLVGAPVQAEKQVCPTNSPIGSNAAMMRASHTAPKRRSVRRWLVLAHRYGAFALGAWLIVLGLTGIALAWRDRLDRWLNPTLLGPGEPGAGLATLIDVHRAAQRDFPRARIERIRAPDTELLVYRVTLLVDGRRRVGSARLEAFYDPANAALLGSRDPDARALRRTALAATIHDLHHRLLLGNTGKDAVGLVGLALVAMVGAGYLLALPHWRPAALKRAVSIKVGASAKRVVYDLHRAAGVVLGGGLALAGSTGFLLAYPDTARDLARLAAPVRLLPEVPFQVRERSDDDLPSALAALARHYPTRNIVEIHLPRERSTLLLAYLRAPGDWHRLGDTVAVIDLRSGQWLTEQSPRERSGGETLLHWLLPMHGGSAFGAAGPYLLTMIGVLPPLLMLSGLWVWLNKRRGARHSRTHTKDMLRGAMVEPRDRSGRPTVDRKVL